MAICEIAGLRVDLKNMTGRTGRQAAPYISADQSEDSADIVIDVTPQRVQLAAERHPELNSNDWEYMLTGSDFYNALIEHDGVLLHSSCVAVDGVAYAFSADSGTGKSTHTALWLKHFGERAHMVNDDKPAIRIIDGRVFACGTPWSGKYDYSTPELLPLAGICFLERSEENRIKRADPSKAIYNFFAQTVRHLEADRMKKLLSVLDRIFKLVPIYELGCNISDEAVLTSYNAMKPKDGAD